MRNNGNAPRIKGPLMITVVDGCAYGRAGMVEALRQTLSSVTGRVRVTGFASLEAFLQACLAAERARMHALHKGGLDNDAPRAVMSSPEMGCRQVGLVIRLPSVPQQALSMLLQLGDFARHLATTVRVTVLSPYAFDGVFRVLERLRIAHPIQIVAARLSVGALCDALMPPRVLDVRSLDRWLGQSAITPASALLTQLELWALQQSVLAVPMYKQSRRRAVVPKTLYGQRASALRKLGAPHLNALLRWFSEPGRSAWRHAKRYRVDVREA